MNRWPRHKQRRAWMALAASVVTFVGVTFVAWAVVASVLVAVMDDGESISAVLPATGVSVISSVGRRWPKVGSPLATFGIQEGSPTGDAVNLTCFVYLL